MRLLRRESWIRRGQDTWAEPMVAIPSRKGLVVTVFLFVSSRGWRVFKLPLYAHVKYSTGVINAGTLIRGGYHSLLVLLSRDITVLASIM
jgi:hypothetical protein